jgi:allophanate hydrolase subunit 2
VPPNGLPVILGPDHPVTGGYPVIGVVVDGDIDKLAQVRPGQHVRLHWARPRRSA